MAYTIISQNNNTTTLTDGVNTITVPSRVNLTSGNFTIVEVNNNMATLEDGDGNVYRDIPCVATLVSDGGGGSSLPDQTGHSGEFLTTDGTDASWSDKPLVNNATGSQSIGIGQFQYQTSGSNSIAIGDHSGASGDRSVALGPSARGDTNYTVSVGPYANIHYGTVQSKAYSTAVGASAMSKGLYSVSLGCTAVTEATGGIQIGYGTNSEAGTLSIGLTTATSPWTSTNYKLLDSDGTIPTARLTKVNSTITLTAAGWSNGSQTVTVTGMTATGVVLVSPDPTDQSAYTSAGIICTAQGTDSLTFTATTTPSADIDVVVVAM